MSELYYKLTIGDKRQNQFMRIADLFKEGEGVYMSAIKTIQLKPGVRVTKKLIKQIADKMKSNIENAGGEVAKIVCYGKKVSGVVTAFNIEENNNDVDA